MVIECIGLPGSGKTYLMDKLDRQLGLREVEYVNVTANCAGRLLWKIGRRLARALIFLSGDARMLRKRMRGILEEAGEHESRFGIYQNADYTIRSLALYNYLYRRMIKTHTIYLFDEGMVHALVKLCADFGYSDETFRKMAQVSEQGIHTSRLVILNEISREDCFKSIRKRDRHVCEFDELDDSRLTEILGEYERLNNAYRKDFSVMEVRREEETPKKIGRIISRIRYLLEKAGERAGR